MKGIIVQFRRGRKRIKERHYLLDLGLTSRDEAKKMAGKQVEWVSPSGKIIQGQISSAHGNNGLVRAISLYTSKYLSYHERRDNWR